jgi:hypothetical protein
VHNIDEMLRDLGADVGRGRRFREWFAPLDPGAYAPVLRAVLARCPAVQAPAKRSESQSAIALTSSRQAS